MLLRDKYQIIDRVKTQGAQATVYYAKDISSLIDKIYIVKQFTPKYDDEFQFQVGKRLFQKEAEILHKLSSHSQIPQIFDYFEEQGQFFLVQEYIDGDNFQQELDDKQRITETETINFLKDILPVLEFVHQNNCIHRDIKPSNLIRNKVDRKIYLIDFGGVKEKIKSENIDSQGKQTSTVVVGTHGYMPKEQNDGKPEFCSDIYALGMVVIQALTGIFPGNLTHDENYNPIWRDRLPKNNYNFKPNFLDLIDKMVRFNYHQRYQSVREVLIDLEGVDKTVIEPRKATKELNSLLRRIIIGVGITAVGVSAIFFAVTKNFYSQIRRSSETVDIAVVKFTSNNEYDVAKLGESQQLAEGQAIYLSGYPGSGQIIGESDRYYR